MPEPTYQDMPLPVIDSPPMKPGAQSRRSIPELLAPLDQVAADSPNLVANHGAHFTSGDQTYELPRYLFVGPRGGDDVIRLGIFAGLHGDEPEGVHALIQFLSMLERTPGTCCGVLPVHLPGLQSDGVQERSHPQCARREGLNREFWNGSEEPEVKLLQSELVAHFFHGIISLHTDDSSHGFYGFARGAMLTKNLVEPALQAAEQFLPRNANETIDGFRARNGIIRDTPGGAERASTSNRRTALPLWRRL